MTGVAYAERADVDPDDPRHSAETPSAIIRRVYEAFNRRDLDTVVALAHADIEVHPLRSPGAWPVRGRDALRAMLADARAAGRNHRYEIGSIAELDDGTLVVAGTITEDGVSSEFVALHRVEDRLNRHVRQYYSDAETLRRLGVIT